VAKSSARVRQRGGIRKRGNSYQVRVYAGVDPLTGRELRLVESAADEASAKRLLNRLVARVEDQEHARTRATLGAALDAWLRVHEAEETTLDGYAGYIRRIIKPALGEVSIGKITPQLLEEFYAELRRCRRRCRDGQPAVDHRTTRPHECRTVRHRRRPGRPNRAGHDCKAAGCTAIECPPHQCTPMASSAIRQVHWILSAALAAAVRWNDLAAGVLGIRRNYVRSRGRAIEKDTKTHQMRRIALDAATVEVLVEHRQRYEELARHAQIEPDDNAYVFSYKPAQDGPCDPSSVTHRYSKMCRELGIDSHLHALRHYSANEFHGWRRPPHGRRSTRTRRRWRHDASRLRRMGRRIRPASRRDPG